MNQYKIVVSRKQNSLFKSKQKFVSRDHMFPSDMAVKIIFPSRMVRAIRTLVFPTDTFVLQQRTSIWKWTGTSSAGIITKSYSVAKPLLRIRILVAIMPISCKRRSLSRHLLMKNINKTIKTS